MQWCSLHRRFPQSVIKRREVGSPLQMAWSPTVPRIRGQLLPGIPNPWMLYKLAAGGEGGLDCVQDEKDEGRRTKDGHKSDPSRLRAALTNAPAANPNPPNPQNSPQNPSFRMDPGEEGEQTG